MTSEESKGLWHNIRAKRARGEAPARKGSEEYNKAVAAAKKINATNEEIKIEEDTPDYISVAIIENGKKVGTFEMESYDGRHYTIIDANIDTTERGKGYYKKAIIELLNKKPNIIIHSVFRSPEAERAWQSLLKTLPSDIKTKTVRYPEEQTSDIMVTKSGSLNEIDLCEKCALALLEDIKAGKLPMMEAEYQGRSVPLNKPMRGDVKKFKVYVKKGDKVVKVNFGDPNMRIKKSNPERRKSFRARHNCDNPGPKYKARYWSCRKW